jgi:glutathione S-transferase
VLSNVATFTVRRVGNERRVLALYQAEWCPYSAKVRERLTELGLDFVAHQVPPWPEQRDELRQRAGTDEIPVLETDEGEFVQGVEEILRYLRRFEPWQHEHAHRERFVEHRRSP